MTRITEKDLNGTVDRINRTAGTPAAPWIKTITGKTIAAIGNYHLDWAYGGVRLVQMDNEGGGIRTITPIYTSKRECYHQIHAFLSGLTACKAA